LRKIKGIGKKLSKIISEYRDTNGYFKSIDELKDIEGIGKNKFAQLKSRLKIGE
jgi:competence ComEA-like helix-hairpin-helix protein